MNNIEQPNEGHCILETSLSPSLSLSVYVYMYVSKRSRQMWSQQILLTELKVLLQDYHQ